MDSLTHLVLGASIGEFLGGKKYGRIAAGLGAILGSIPDVDVFIGPLLYSDPIQTELFHRGVTHSLLFAVAAAPILGLLISRLMRVIKKKGNGNTNTSNKTERRNRTIISFRGVVAHQMLDMLTGYGTQWLRPFSTMSLTGDSVFIVDPLYTIPFLILLVIALCYRKGSAHRRLINGLALMVSTLYLLRGVGVKIYAQNTFIDQFEQQGAAYQSLHASPEPFTTFLRRGRAEDEENRYIGRRSIFDKDNEIGRKVYSKNHELLTPYIHDTNVKKILARRKYNIIVQPASQGIKIIPIQFGDLLGRSQEEENFMFSYEAVENGSGVLIEHSNRNTRLTPGRFSTLRERIGM